MAYSDLSGVLFGSRDKRSLWRGSEDDANGATPSTAAERRPAMTDLDSPSSALCRRHAPELLKVMARLAETARDPELRVFLRRELEAQLLRLKQLANDPTLSAELRQEYQIIRTKFFDS